MKYHALALVAVISGMMTYDASGATVATDPEIRVMLARRVDVQKQAVGIVVGIVTPRGARFVSYGAVSVNDRRAPNERSVFEIGSIGKVFTALLLADMVERGEAGLADPVSKYLPPGRVTVPRYEGREITLVDLATHTSGLPLRPANLTSQIQLNKYAGFTVEQLYRGISDFRLDRAPGSRFEYSNWGYGLLGNAIAYRSGRSYEVLVLERIAQPLGLKSTRVGLTPDMRRRLVTGHTPDLTPGIFEGTGALEAAGEMHSTASDLARVLEYFMGRRSSPLGASMASMTQRMLPTDNPSTRIGLAWRETTVEGHSMFWSAGRTDGFRSFIGYSKATGVGVVALANVGSDAGADDIAMHLVDDHFPMNLQGPDDHKEIHPSAEVLDRYVGRYRFDDGTGIEILRDHDILVAIMDGQGSFLLHAEAPAAFFLTEVDAQFTFETDANGPARSLTNHQNGQEFRAERIP
jgi:CubicO group peptidase (beta-lactamase class C family)